METLLLLLLFYCFWRAECIGLMKTYWKTPKCEGDWSFRTYVHEDRCFCFQDDFVSMFDMGKGDGCSRTQIMHHEGRQKEMIEDFRTFWDCDHDNPHYFEENNNYERFGHCEDRGNSQWHGKHEYRSLKVNRVPWFSWFAAYTPIGPNDLGDLYYSMEECEGNHVFAIAVRDYYDKTSVFPNVMRFEPGDCPGKVCLESLPNREGRGSVIRGCGVQPWPSHDYTFIVIVIGMSLCCMVPICLCYLCCSLSLGLVIFTRMTKYPDEEGEYDSDEDEEILVIDDSNETIEVIRSSKKSKHQKQKKQKKKKQKKKETKKETLKDDEELKESDDNEEVDKVYEGSGGTIVYNYVDDSEDQDDYDYESTSSRSYELSSDVPYDSLSSSYYTSDY